MSQVTSQVPKPPNGNEVFASPQLVLVWAGVQSGLRRLSRVGAYHQGIHVRDAHFAAFLLCFFYLQLMLIKKRMCVTAVEPLWLAEFGGM
jgi:hypothetical protein